MCGLNFIILFSKLIHLHYFNICKSKPHILSLFTLGEITQQETFFLDGYCAKQWMHKCPHPLLTRHIQHVIYPSSDPIVPVLISTTAWTDTWRVYLKHKLSLHTIIWSTLTVKLKMNHSTNYHLQSHNIQEISWSRWSQTSGGSHTRFSSHPAKAV